MKDFLLPITLFILFLFAAVFPSMGSASCRHETIETVEKSVTSVPEELKGAVIIVKTKDGLSHQMSIDDFMVVKRQKDKIQRIKKMTCVAENSKEKKHQITLGISSGITSVGSKSTGGGLVLYSEKNAIFDINLYKKDILLEYGLGVGIYSTGELRGQIGKEF